MNILYIRVCIMVAFQHSAVRQRFNAGWITRLVFHSIASVTRQKTAGIKWMRRIVRHAWDFVTRLHLQLVTPGCVLASRCGSRDSDSRASILSVCILYYYPTASIETLFIAYVDVRRSELRIWYLRGYLLYKRSKEIPPKTQQAYGVLLNKQCLLLYQATPPTP